jgi:hypothetical protein
MARTNGNDSAFPQEYVEGQLEGGLTKREYFAGLAMQSMLIRPEVYDVDFKADPSTSWLMPRAVQAADELIFELNKFREPKEGADAESSDNNG